MEIIEEQIFKFLDREYPITNDIEVHVPYDDGHHEQIIIDEINGFFDIKNGSELFEKWFDNRIGDICCIVYPNGDKYCFKDNNLHRDDGLPAVIDIDGTKEWWFNGKKHRDNGEPAIIRTNGTKEWWVNGNRHRENGPAVIRTNGTKEWWVNGNRHRENGPAIIYGNGDKLWYKNGEYVKNIESEFYTRKIW